MSKAVELVTFLQSLFTITALLVGGWWTYWKFIRQREDCPKTEFDLDIKFVGTQDGKYLIEVSANVTNKGLVRHRLADFTLNVHYLLPDDPLVSGGPRINHQIDFIHSINHDENIKDRFLVPWKPFVDPGVTQSFIHITSIPIEATFVLLWSKFRYENIRDTNRHLAQKVFKVPH